MIPVRSASTAATKLTNTETQRLTSGTAVSRTAVVMAHDFAWHRLDLARIATAATLRACGNEKTALLKMRNMYSY
jgi:hypothetical protein